MENCLEISDLVVTLMGTLKPHSNRPLYSNAVIGTLAVDRWVVTFYTAAARTVPSSLYQL